MGEAIIKSNKWHIIDQVPENLILPLNFFRVSTKYLKMYKMQSSVNRRVKTMKKFHAKSLCMKTIKENVGIDISKDSFVVCLASLQENQDRQYTRAKSFRNNEKGFEELLKWVAKYSSNPATCHYTMEATGVYYEALAFFLAERKLTVHVVLPNTVKNFIKSLNIASKTDSIDAKSIAQMGVERTLKQWVVGSKKYLKLRALTRERERWVHDRTRHKNQYHALITSKMTPASTKKRYEQAIDFFNKQIEDVNKEILKLLSDWSEIKEKFEKITSVPGISTTTAATVIAETIGFENIHNVRQLTSYAGYDVVERQSGKYKGKSKISKKGNSHIRRVLYMAAVNSLQRTEKYKAYYDNKYPYKANGLVPLTAIQRKLLILMYTLWNKNECFVDKYEQRA